MNDGKCIQGIVERVRSVAGPGLAALHEPDFLGREQEYVAECIDTGWVSTAGSFVGRFEKALAGFTGVRSVIATSTGTAALHACLHALGIGRGDEVLLPALTFVATANAVSYTHATPHFVDVSERTLGVAPESLAAYLEEHVERTAHGCRNRCTGRRIGALIVMHCFGHPADLRDLMAICDRFGFPLVEDAAEALGSLYDGRHVGRFGRVAALSFNGNKILTSGGGGAVLCEDEELALRIRHLTTTARVSDGFEFSHDMVGFNYRLPNINAAIGCGQMEYLDSTLAAKRRLARAYQSVFRDCSIASMIYEPAGTSSNYWLNTLLLQPDQIELRNPLLGALQAAGYQCRPLWKPMHLLPMYAICPRAPLPVTEELHRRAVSLPSSARLGRKLQPE